MQLKHIDTGFFQLSASQAKQFLPDGKLPRVGYMKGGICPDGVTLLTAQGERSKLQCVKGTRCQVTHTRVNGKQVLAIFGFR
jgi:hypothetical protein